MNASVLEAVFISHLIELQVNKFLRFHLPPRILLDTKGRVFDIETERTEDGCRAGTTVLSKKNDTVFIDLPVQIFEPLDSVELDIKT